MRSGTMVEGDLKEWTRRELRLVCMGSNLVLKRGRAKVCFTG